MAVTAALLPWRARPGHLGVRAPVKGDVLRRAPLVCPSPTAASPRLATATARVAEAEIAAELHRRFAALRRQGTKPRPLGASRDQAARRPLLRIAGGSPKRHHVVRTEPAANTAAVLHRSQPSPLISAVVSTYSRPPRSPLHPAHLT
jgi:hypothetical protein